MQFPNKRNSVEIPGMACAQIVTVFPFKFEKKVLLTVERSETQKKTFSNKKKILIDQLKNFLAKHFFLTIIDLLFL